MKQPHKRSAGCGTPGGITRFSGLSIVMLCLAGTLLTCGVLLTACQANSLLTEVETRVQTAQSAGTTPNTPIATYTVAYDANGAGSGTVPVDNTKYEKGQTVTVLGNTGSLALSGSTFIGWNTAANGNGTNYSAGSTFGMPASNLVLYARWTTNPTFSVVYEPNGADSGTAPADSNRYEQGQTVTVSGNTGSLALSGYNFDGWNTAADGSGVAYSPGSTVPMPSTGLTLYAQWKNRWQPVGIVGFSSGTATWMSPLRLDSSGTPYVAFSDGTHSGNATVMKFAGNSWVNVGLAGFSAGAAWFNSLAFDSSDTPYIAYQDNGNGAGATVERFNGSSWVGVGPSGFVSGGVDGTSLAFDSADTPYLAFEDAANSYKATVMKYAGSSWVDVGSPDFSAGRAAFISLAFNSSDTPYVVYADTPNSSKARVENYNGSSWVDVGSPDFSAGGANYVTLAFDSFDTPYVAFADSANSSKATVMVLSGGNWVNVGLPDFSAGTANYISLSLDSTNTPFVTYEDGPNGNKATVKKFNGSTWVDVGTGDFSDGQAYYTSLAFDSSDIPYVAYEDNAHAGKVTVKSFQ